MMFTLSHVPSSAFPGLGSQPPMCSSRTARRLQQCHHHSPLHCTRDRDSPPGHISAPTSQHSHSSSTLKRAKAGGPEPAVHSGVLCREGTSPIMCLAPWSSLPRAAYVLTGRNTGKQLAASDPVVSQQESVQMPTPPFHGQHPHFQMCLAGVKFRLCSGTFIYIFISYFVLKLSMCHWPTLHLGKCPSGSALVCLQVCLLLHVKHELMQPDHCKAPYRSCYALEIYLLLVWIT